MSIESLVQEKLRIEKAIIALECDIGYDMARAEAAGLKYVKGAKYIKNSNGIRALKSELKTVNVQIDLARSEAKKEKNMAGAFMTNAKIMLPNETYQEILQATKEGKNNGT